MVDHIPDYDIDGLMFFPGKELSGDVSISGKRMPHRPIRLAVGIDGVYKFDSDTDQIITFWSYADIIDWNFSGYSFTLNLKSKIDYHVRTNDGPSICHWIEVFSKSPEQAISTSKELKSSGDYSSTNTNQPVVYYTLNNRKRHNKDSQTRLLSAYGVDRKQLSTSQQSINVQQPMSNGNDLKRWSTGLTVYNKPQRSVSVDILDTNTVIDDNRTKSMDCINTTNTTISAISSNSSINDTDTDTDDEEPPVVPPRNASLKSSPLIQSTSPKTSPTKTQNISIHVNETATLSFPKKPHPHNYEEIEIGVSSKYNKLEIASKQQQQQLPNNNNSDYDHLFPGKKQHKPVIRRKRSQDNKQEVEDHVFTPIRRNESLPPMAFHSPVVVKVSNDDESGVSDSEIDEPVSPLPEDNSNEEGVVLRRKSNDSADPFVDLLSAPPNKSRLRWSQELNPIYDYIKGVKISPKLGYDSLATTIENIIQEEDTQDTLSISSRHSSTDSQFDNLVLVPQSAPNTLQRVKRMQHNYEEVVFGPSSKTTVTTNNRPLSENYSQQPQIEDISNNRSHTIRSSPLRRLKSSDQPFIVSPQINKRVLPRKSKTARARDDSNAPQGSQQARHVADTMRDFSYITRDYRLFFIKMPSGHVISEVVNINKQVNVLMDKLAQLLGARNTDSYSLFVEGSILTTMKEASLEFGELQPAKAHINASSVSLTQLVDNNSLADQGDTPILLKNSLTFRVQGITTGRILRLDDVDDVVINDLHETFGSARNEFHKAWLAVVQGNQPMTLDNAVKLAAMQYQAYFVERTAENSVIGFCRPTEFLPAEFAGIRAIEGKIYKEQEKIKSRSHSQIQRSYVEYCKSLPTSNTIFFPVREARRRLLHSAKLKPVLLGVNKRGILRVCPKSKEVLESWEYQVLKNWAYSKRTFVVAFSNKNYPVESNQAKWISDLVDFYVHSIVHSSDTPPSSTD